jgi:hypothetical protein
MAVSSLKNQAWLEFEDVNNYRQLSMQVSVKTHEYFNVFDLTVNSCQQLLSVIDSFVENGH